jgi:type II secretory pathway component GspD/PulD (secretin)
VSKRIPLKYLDVTKVMELLPATVPDENIVVIPDQNALVVMEATEMVEEIEAYLAQLDVPTPQVMIQVYLLELTHGTRQELGLSLDGGKDRTVLSLGPGFGLSFDTLERVPEAFQATLTALVNSNRGQVLANPLVSVVSGERAEIKLTTKTHFNITSEIFGLDVPAGRFARQDFKTIETGITLEITPWIGAAGEITMKILPDVTSADFISREQSSTTTRSVDTTIRVKDQGMIIIGGLLQEKELVVEDKIPLLHHIPLLGKLFTSRNASSEQTELIVIIQPRIIP